ncbi:uridine kinase [Angomonas deanei]|uniref:Uridine kinase n=1 Tax=Angomonas deanei TaxID=59799 RepID=S9VF86_9TRYP|nr:uridine kinase [Angomonas deanei]EPY42565.1 uridine kinase [Angomonas deanei]CAD2213535.1 Phosphoribulokinase / Uridine kinase family/AAA domain containing protein, putative [Angomonas deanei]|eukprot:EPY39548.1 uridine kinase [Angomonas deanei]
MTTVVVGITGASGSGKTRLAASLFQYIAQQHGEASVGVICEDYYYKDQQDIPFQDRRHTNYDHPNSMDHDLLMTHLAALRAGQSVSLPQYDYTQHTRSSDTIEMAPKTIIIVEGILLFADEKLRTSFDYLIYVDTPLDICFIRRAERDMRERGRAFEGIAQQYERTVRPMYFAFIELSKCWADIIVPSWKENDVAVEFIQSRICAHLLKK